MKLKFHLIGLFIIILISVTCSNKNSVEPTIQNRPPQILSVDVFPSIIGPNDSLLVICNAVDPDGDTLVYDWITDARVRIKGAQNGNWWLFHTSENQNIFYPTPVVSLPYDTLWIQCFARDVKGGSVSKLVRFIVQQSFL